VRLELAENLDELLPREPRRCGRSTWSVADVVSQHERTARRLSVPCVRQNVLPQKVDTVVDRHRAQLLLDLREYRCCRRLAQSIQSGPIGTVQLSHDRSEVVLPAICCLASPVLADPGNGQRRFLLRRNVALPLPGAAERLLELLPGDDLTRRRLSPLRLQRCAKQPTQNLNGNDRCTRRHQARGTAPPDSSRSCADQQPRANGADANHLHRQVLRTPSEAYELLGLDRFKKCLSRPRAYDGKRFAVHGVVDEYMGIPPAARRVLKCDDGGRFRVIRKVAPDLLLYTTVFAVTAADADRLDDALDGSSISLLVRLVHAPPDGDWKGFIWFEKSPKPREFAFVVERFLTDGEVLKELPPKAFSKV